MQSSPVVGRQERSHPVAVVHEVQLIDSLGLAPLVLEPHLDHSHGQTRVLGQLFSHQPRGFGI